jgi:hypothetical protein
MLGIFKANELEKIAGREIELTNRKTAALAQLASARDAAGIAMVESDARVEIESVARLAAEVETATRAIELVRGRRPEAIAAENRKSAEAIRAEATTKKKEFDSLQSKTSKLFGEISKLEGVPYDNWVLGYQPEGCVPFDSVLKRTPKSEALALEVQSLESKADALQAASVPPHGYVDIEITSDEDAVLATLKHRSAGPSAEMVKKWLTSCADHNRVPGRSFGDLPRRVRIEWRDGAIDRNTSVVSVRALTRKRTDTISTELYEVASGEFRARNADADSKYSSLVTNAA